MSDMVKRDKQAESSSLERTRSGVTFSPQVDILETDEELILFGDLPGAAAEDLDVRFENNELIVDARVPLRHGEVEYLYGEYAIGDFHRAFAIGEGIDAARISAELRNGVLTVHLPKSEAVKPKRIQVKAE
jgi:HSP20 family molecular chaperone IbpA